VEIGKREKSEDINETCNASEEIDLLYMQLFIYLFIIYIYYLFLGQFSMSHKTLIKKGFDRGPTKEMGHPSMQDTVGTNNTMGRPLRPFFMPRKFPLDFDVYCSLCHNIGMVKVSLEQI
jgi:hypothetical protein